MSKESFESLNDYQLNENYKILVAEALNEADDDDGMFGKIIDRGLSFVPRAMRFKKAKKVMRKYLTQYTKKAKNIIDKFAAGFNSKIDTINDEYKKLMNDKIKPLLEDDDSQQIISILEPQKKELEEYKKEQINILDKSIEGILSSYTAAVDKRIESPGFVLNVELSEKGKGELKAKWQELAAIEKIEIDKAKTKLIQSKGWKRIDEIIAEISSLIEKHRYGARSGNMDFKIQQVKPIPNGFTIKVHLKTYKSRINVVEKGIIISESPDKLNLDSGAKIAKSKGTYEFSAKPYALNVTGVKSSNFIVPYMKIKESTEPIYGESGQIEDFIIQSDTQERTQRELVDEEPIRNPENN